jgi:riboflavin kinase / FMN adenylyltransferase
MIVETDPGALRPRLVHPVATIGNFDGVHRGHQAIFARVLDRARALGGTSVAITFDPHPLKVLAPGRAPDLIATPRQKLAFIEAAGIDAVLNLHFDAALAATGAEQFVDAYLRDALALREVYVGANFNFGRGREGTADTLVALCEARGIAAGKVEEVRFLGSPVSSSRIRRAIRAGEVELAGELLGRPFAVEGVVRHGAGRGAGLGFPTANLDPPAGVIVPKLGIYAGATLDVRAAVSVGTNPTYGVDELRIEAFLLDFEGDLYGRRLVVELWRRLRDEVAFASEQELVDQIARDVADTRAAVRPGPNRPAGSGE